MFARFVVPKTYWLEHYRGIALVSCFCKWYMGVLVLIYEQQTARPSQWLNACSLGFQVGHHVGSLTGAILMIFRSAYEWRVSNPCCMFIGDILQAFDNVNPLLMSLTMNEAGAHPHLNAAITEEADYLSAEVRF